MSDERLATREELEAEVARLELLLAVARNDAEHFGDVALEHEGMRREAEAALERLKAFCLEWPQDASLEDVEAAIAEPLDSAL